MFHGMHNPSAPMSAQRLPSNRKQIFLGNRLASTIAATSGRTLAFEITQNVGPTMFVTSYQLVYATGLETALINLYDQQHNRELISGNVQLSTVGHLDTLASAMPFIPIAPFELATGQSVQVYITNESSTAATAGDIALTLYGYQA